MSQPRALIIAGPNGAGKTTFAREYLPREVRVLNFINADLIAAGLAPFNPESAALRAGRIMLEQIESAVKERVNFSFETTLSGRLYADRILRWQKDGYHVKLMFLKLSTPELAVERVRLRVSQGGHNIPEEVIRRRFEKGWQNFQHLFRGIVDAWTIYDCSGDSPKLIEHGER